MYSNQNTTEMSGSMPGSMPGVTPGTTNTNNAMNQDTQHSIGNENGKQNQLGHADLVANSYI